MFAQTTAFSGFAVDDIDRAREFYGKTLGVEVKTIDEATGLLTLELEVGKRTTFIYAKNDLRPANYTILNFEVDDIDAAVDDLAAKGVQFERYDGFDQDDKGIARGPGPSIAWFKDPAGNILSVLQQPG